jgi:uncharacterized cupin superfamily protein
MKYMRIYSGADGESRFEDVESPMKNYSPSSNPAANGDIKQSEIVRATGICFNEYPSGMDWGGCHTAPRRQFVIIIEGKWEFTTSQGVKRRLGAGDVLLTEDTTGKGHFSKVVGRKILKNVVVLLLE